MGAVVVGIRRTMRLPVVVVLFAAALAFALSTTVFAHPGRTDGSGGHYDRETGEYHYHHGFEAHQHVNGECPFDFVDLTGQNSGGDGSGGTRTSGSGTGGNYEDKEDKDSLLATLIAICILAGFVAYIPTFIVDFALISILLKDKVSSRSWDTLWLTYIASVCFTAAFLYKEYRDKLIFAGAAILIVHFLISIKGKKEMERDAAKKKEAELKKASVEQSNKVNAEDGRHIVYITQSGRLYHSSRACPYLARSKKVATIYEDQALRRGRRKCPKCTKYMID